MQKRNLNDFVLQTFSYGPSKQMKKVKFENTNVYHNNIRLVANYVKGNEKIENINFSNRKLTTAQQKLKEALYNLFKTKPVWLFRSLLSELNKQKICIVSTYNVKMFCKKDLINFHLYFQRRTFQESLYIKGLRSKTFQRES